MSRLPKPTWYHGHKYKNCKSCKIEPESTWLFKIGHGILSRGLVIKKIKNKSMASTRGKALLGYYIRLDNRTSSRFTDFSSCKQKEGTLEKKKSFDHGTTSDCETRSAIYSPTRVFLPDKRGRSVSLNNRRYPKVPR